MRTTPFFRIEGHHLFLGTLQPSLETFPDSFKLHPPFLAAPLLPDPLTLFPSRCSNSGSPLLPPKIKPFSASPFPPMRVHSCSSLPECKALKSLPQVRRAHPTTLSPKTSLNLLLISFHAMCSFLGPSSKLLQE